MQKALIWRFAVVSVNLLLMNHVVLGADRVIIPASTTKVVPSQDSTEIREFEVRVDNKPRGTHSLTIKSNKDKTEVSIQTDVKVDLIVYAYTFKSRGTEVWRGGRVDYADLSCDDGGKKRAFSLKTNGKDQKVAFNEKSVPVSSPGIMTTAYWQLPAADLRMKPLTVFDIDTGLARTASLNLVETTTVTFGERTLPCQHFKIDGPSPAELWFDDQNRLVRQKSIEQGHSMELRLKQIRLSKDDRS